MTRDEAQAALTAIAADLHQQFGDNAGRLEQLDSHTATVAMVIDHLFDEAARAADGG